MSYTRKIAHNTIIQIIGKAISTVIGVVVIGMLTRYLGAAGFGQYTTIMAFLQIFGILVDFGLYIILVKKISEPGADEQKIASNIFTIRFFSAVVFLGLAPLIVLFFPYASVVKWGVLVTSLSFLAITLNQTVSGIFQKHLRMDKVVISEVVGRLILIAGTWYVIKENIGLSGVMWSVVAGSLINFILTFLFCRRLVRIRLAFDGYLWREILRESWPIGLSIVFNLIYLKADIIVLSLYHSEAAVGVYGAASKVLEVLVTLPAMFAGLVLPLLTSVWKASDQERFRRILNKSFQAMLLIAAPLIVGVWFVADPVMDLIAPEFHDSAAVLKILIVATSIIFVGNLFGNTVVALNKQKTMMWLYLLVAVAALVGYFSLIPAYSYFGAAWVRTLSELLITIFALTLVIRVAHVSLDTRVIIKIFLSCAVMAIAMFAFSHLPVIWLILIGGAAYALAIAGTRAVTRETIREIIRFS